MTIDKKQLVELLVEKTSMNRGEIETQLNQLIERILDAAKRGRALEIKEFGVFYFDEEGKLRFDPADELSTEISFKYAGMKPVELKPERDTSISDIDEDFEDKIEEDEEEDPFADPFDEPEAVEEQQMESSIKKDVESDSEEEEDAPFDFDDSDEQADESIIDDPFSSEPLEPFNEPAEKEETTNVRNLKPISRQPVRRKDNTGIFVLIGIVLAAVLIGGYIYYMNTPSQNQTDSARSSSSGQMQTGIIDENENSNANEMEPENSPTNNGQGDIENQQMAAGNQTSAEQAAPNEGTEEEVVSNDGTVSSSETNQPVYGLTGSVIEEANNGYSIVVHSFRTEENAREAADQLQAEEYRVVVSSRTVYENLVWRVSVGQFETLNAAQQATTQLPEPYSTQNFIQRIRTN